MDDELMKIGLGPSPGHDPVAFQAGFDEIEASFNSSPPLSGSVANKERKEMALTNRSTNNDGEVLSADHRGDELVDEDMAETMIVLDNLQAQQCTESTMLAPSEQDIRTANALMMLSKGNMDWQATAEAPFEDNQQCALPKSREPILHSTPPDFEPSAVILSPPPRTESSPAHGNRSSSVGRSSLLAEMRVEDVEAAEDVTSPFPKHVQESPSHDLPDRTNRRLFSDDAVDVQDDQSGPIHGSGTYDSPFGTAKTLKRARSVSSSSSADAEYELVDTPPARSPHRPEAEKQNHEVIIAKQEESREEQSMIDQPVVEQSGDPPETSQAMEKEEQASAEETQLTVATVDTTPHNFRVKNMPQTIQHIGHSTPPQDPNKHDLSALIPRLSNSSPKAFPQNGIEQSGKQLPQKRGRGRPPKAAAGPKVKRTQPQRRGKVVESGPAETPPILGPGGSKQIREVKTEEDSSVASKNPASTESLTMASEVGREGPTSMDSRGASIVQGHQSRVTGLLEADFLDNFMVHRKKLDVATEKATTPGSTKVDTVKRMNKPGRAEDSRKPVSLAPKRHATRARSNKRAGDSNDKEPSSKLQTTVNNSIGFGKDIPVADTVKHDESGGVTQSQQKALQRKKTPAIPAKAKQPAVGGRELRELARGQEPVKPGLAGKTRAQKQAAVNAQAKPSRKRARK